MKVIGAGFGRTGTSSMKAALEELGFGPCHHMEEVFKHTEQIPGWVALAEGKGADWPTLLRGYNSAVDFPSQFWYRELMAQWPEAKVILTVRDPEAWYRSARETIYAISKDAPMRWVGRYLPVVGGMYKVTSGKIWDGLFEGKFLDREHALAIFQRNTEEVKAFVPPERLLVFDVKQGWEPLCKFLEVPVPATPFPRRNDTAEFKRRVLTTKIVCWLLILFPLLVLSGLGWWWLG